MLSAVRFNPSKAISSPLNGRPRPSPRRVFIPSSSKKASTVITAKEVQHAIINPYLATITLVATCIVAISPVHAALDTATFKAGPSATVEASNLKDQSPEDIVKSLKDVVLPEAYEKLDAYAKTKGSSYSRSIVQELKTVESEIEALDTQVKQGQNSSNVKSAASSVELQINALKALLGFD